MRSFVIDRWQLPDIGPTNGGKEYGIRPDPHVAADLENALIEMSGTVGNVIRFRPGRHTVEARARGAMVAGLANVGNGAPGRPNIFTGDDGHELRGVQTGEQAFPTVDLAAVRWWDAIGLNIVGSDYVGVRVQAAGGCDDFPARVWGNQIAACHSAAVAVQAWWKAPWVPSSHVHIAGNTIAGDVEGECVDEYCEGIYISTGYSLPDHPEWVDLTSKVTISANRISRIKSDAIEIKTGATDFTIEDNEIFDCQLVKGSTDTSIPVAHVAIVYANTPRPDGDIPIRGVVRRNRLWNLTQESGSVRPPILIGRGGVHVTSNIVHRCESDTAIVVGGGRGGLGTGEILLAHNATDKEAVLTPDSYPDIVSHNNLSRAAGRVVGPLDDTADAGWGPLSGYTPGVPRWTPPALTDATGVPFVDPPPDGALNPDEPS